MKLVAKILVGLIALVIVVVAGAFTYLNVAFPKERTVTDLVIERTPERFARGKYLVENVANCLVCHSDHLFDKWGMPVKPGTEGQGGFVFGKDQEVPGIVAAQNITPDPETGLGNWKDDEILRALREGLSRDGRPLFPMMPYAEFHSMSDEDAMSVVAYLRTMPPVKNTVARTKIDFPVSLIIRMIPKPVSGPVIVPSDEKDHHAYGEYLTTIGGCGGCHTPRDDKGGPDHTRTFQGGWEMKGPWGRNITPNLTPAPSSFIGRSTKAEFIARFKAFETMDASTAPVAPKGRNTVMNWLGFSRMTESDLGAIYDYLRSVPPVEKPVVNAFPDAPLQ